MGSEPSSSAEPQAGDADTPQPQAGNTTTPEPQAGEGTESISLDEAKKLRSEANNLRKRLKDTETLANELKTFKEQAEAAQLSDTEKRERASQQREKQFADLQAAHDNLTVQLQEERVNHAIQLHAIQQGIDPKLAQRLLDRTQLEHDDTGQPTNLDAAFKAMVKEFNISGGKPAPTSGGATNPSRSRSDTANAGEITQAYVTDVMSGKIPWQSLTPERRTAVLNWQAQNSYRF